MSIQNINLHYLDKLMNFNSLTVTAKQFPVTVSFDLITLEQAECIINRSHDLYNRMVGFKKRISDLYGNEQTEKLMINFNDIISYSDKVFEHGGGETFDEYFLKLESFCGQIENIIKMIRYYYALFETNV
jgi:hypothetical protein